MSAVSESSRAFVSEVEGATTLADVELRLKAFELQAVKLFSHHLPPEATEALRVAEAYWAGQGSEQALEDARVGCWKFLKGSPTGEDCRDPQTAATRAVICTLFPLGAGGDIYESAYFFLDMVRFVGAYDREILPLLRTQFPELP